MRGWQRRGGEVTQRVGEMKWHDYLRGFYQFPPGEVHCLLF